MADPRKNTFMSGQEQEPVGTGEPIPRVFDESFAAAARFREPAAAERARRPGWCRGGLRSGLRSRGGP